jgi:geranylgeranyl transferase type-2 subunit alpha
MHGRKKPEQPQSITEASALRQKGELLLRTFDLVLLRNAKKDYSEETLELIERVLRTNPDFYTAWNLRRKILLHMYPIVDGQTCEHGEKLDNDELRNRELKLTEDCIKRNPKSCKRIVHLYLTRNKMEY